MGIGQRKPVELVRIQSIKTQAGNWVEQVDPGPTFQTWAEITDVSGSRNYAEGRTQMDQTKRFLIRFRFDKYPNADWKIKYDGVDWTVSQIQKVDQKRFYWQLTASKSSDV